jgi:hypothetical protein
VQVESCDFPAISLTSFKEHCSPKLSEGWNTARRSEKRTSSANAPVVMEPLENSRAALNVVNTINIY